MSQNIAVHDKKHPKIVLYDKVVNGVVIEQDTIVKLKTQHLASRGQGQDIRGTITTPTEI